MNIENLKQDKCPECNEDLDWDSEIKMLVCSCGFKLSEEDFKDFMDEILDREYKVPNTEENLSRLNNL